MLCEVCRKAIEKAFKDPGTTHPHHLTPTSFIAGVNQTCRICIRLLRFPNDTSPPAPILCSDSFLENGKSTNFSTISMFNQWETVKDDAESRRLAMVFMISETYHRPGYKNYFAAFSLVPTQDFEQQLVSPMEVLAKMSFEASLPIVKRWYDNCSRNHTICNEKRSLYTLPSRLLDVTSYGQGYVRLLDTSPESIRCTYMTLSHKWGATQPLKLTAETEHKLMERFPVAKLPKTFQDAVSVAVGLGASHLWIDSLCIKQDSIDDWEKESSRMREVYGGAKCNIGATGANDGTNGLFFERELSQFGLDTLELLYEEKILSFYLIQSDLSVILDGEPLNLRGWVFQERWLAPCMIHFGRSQLFWECHELTACESFPQGMPKGLDLISSKKTLHSSNRDRSGKLYDVSCKANGIPIDDPIILGLELWASLSVEYAACDLTREEDRLVAFSGVAKDVHQFVGAEYLAGIWDRHIIPQLLWQLNTNGGYHPRNYRAPSWSWASVEAAGWLTTSSGRLSGNLVEVIDAKVILAGDDPTGAVVSGWLKVQGELHSVRIVRIEDDFWIEGLTEDPNWTPRACVDVHLTPEELQRPYFCMPLQEYRPETSPSHIIKGLILDCVNTVGSYYKRVGVFSLSVSGELDLISVGGTFSSEVVNII